MDTLPNLNQIRFENGRPLMLFRRQWIEVLPVAYQLQQHSKLKHAEDVLRKAAEDRARHAEAEAKSARNRRAA